MKKLFVGLVAIMLFITYPAAAFASIYGIVTWDESGDPYNWSAFGFLGVKANIWAWNAFVASSPNPANKVGSVMMRGAVVYPDGMPDFAESGWTKDTNRTVPTYFVAWHNSNGYGLVYYPTASYPAYHNFRVIYQRSDPAGWGGTHLWYGWYDSTWSLQVWNRNRYAAPPTGQEHNNLTDDGYEAINSISEQNSQGVWQAPTDLERGPWGDRGDTNYWFNKTNNTAWQSSHI